MSSNDRVNRFWLIWHDLNAAYEDYARRSGLTCMQTYVIEMLARVPDCTQKTICECTSLPKQNVNALIRKFAEDGIVKLAPNEADRRNKSIHLTEKGRHADRIYKRFRKNMARDILEGMSDCEKLTLIKCVERMNNFLLNRINKSILNRDGLKNTA